ncbi:beta-lactamase-like protein [Apodospora peruviana]|uniref:Beta-lactamase-like protein n=1 Tax=Apodospora peruviana TaxID=516989 RepID=A0AAE0IR40_9PEZI|nr:beta-lactamase-like protein [Apodospora peruviana]
MTSYNPKPTQDLLVCTACGTQYPTADRSALKTCFICDDPRQYTPPSGQSFTTLAEIRQAGHKNTFTPYPDTNDKNQSEIISITTTPKLAIGQRAILIRTPVGNILWDCITLLDSDTFTQIQKLGGLHGIVISHPHYYSTHIGWAEAFDCPVYLSAEDAEWIADDPGSSSRSGSGRRVFLTETETAININGAETGLKAIKLGGHFPGSLVLLYNQSRRLFIADTLMSTPSGTANWSVNALGEQRNRPPGVNSFAFMWSIPNMIPLSAAEIVRMWGILRGYKFGSTHGAFLGSDIEDGNVKRRVLESMQIQIRSMGYTEHEFLRVTSLE